MHQLTNNTKNRHHLTAFSLPCMWIDKITLKRFERLPCDWCFVMLVISIQVARPTSGVNSRLFNRYHLSASFKCDVSMWDYSLSCLFPSMSFDAWDAVFLENTMTHMHCTPSRYCCWIKDKVDWWNTCMLYCVFLFICFIDIHSPVEHALLTHSSLDINNVHRVYSSYLREMINIFMHQNIVPCLFCVFTAFTYCLHYFVATLLNVTKYILLFIRFSRYHLLISSYSHFSMVHLNSFRLLSIFSSVSLLFSSHLATCDESTCSLFIVNHLLDNWWHFFTFTFLFSHKLHKNSRE